MNIKKMNKGLDFLRAKYGAAKGEITLKDGHCYVGTTPLLPGRMERKIVELKKMTENGTLEGVSTLRFAAFAPKGTDPQAMLANDVNVSVEIGTGLPKGELGYDRHEIIAKRGVACDQTVDTHTPHASIRCWDANGAVEYTDVDTELFGLTYEEIWNVRAAFALLQKRADAKIWKSAWAKATKAARLAFKSDKARKAQTIVLKKGLDTNRAIQTAEVR